MDFKQSTIGNILDSEKEMVLKGAERYGEYFINAADFNQLLQEFLKPVDPMVPDRFIFAMFLSQVRTQHTLALFSAVRLHHIQATMNLRQVLEAGACAAYAIANIDIQDFADIDDDGFIDPSKRLAEKRYKWLGGNYEKGSTAIYNMKKSINKGTHSNIVYAHQNFKADLANGKFKTPFFDFEDDFYVKTNLWTIGNIAMLLMDLFYGVNKGREVIKFIDDFIPRLKALEAQNHKLKAEMIGSDRYRRIQQKISRKNKTTVPS